MTRRPGKDSPFVTFGGGVAAESGAIIVAASPLTKGKRGPGTVHVFQRRDSRWVRAEILSAPESRFEDSFGVSMAVDGGHARGRRAVCGFAREVPVWPMSSSG